MKKREFLKKAGILTSSLWGIPYISNLEQVSPRKLDDTEYHKMMNTSSGNIVIGGDHAGYLLKEQLIENVKSWNYKVIDVGCFSPDPVDFPDIALLLVNEILNGNAERGLMVCGTGVGASIACNKIKNIRAALCHDTYSAHQCVEHDNANVLCMGAQIIGVKLACEILQSFLNARFSTEIQFRRRVQKLDEFDLTDPLRK